MVDCIGSLYRFIVFVCSFEFQIPIVLRFPCLDNCAINKNDKASVVNSIRLIFCLIGIAKIIVSTIVCIFCGSLTYTPISTIQYSIKINELTESLFFLMWPFHFCLAIGLGLMSLVGFLQIIEDIHSYIKGDHFREMIELSTDV